MARRLKTCLIALPALLALILSFVPAQAADNPDLGLIRRLEALLMVPCDEPLAYMNELVRLGQSYQEQERQRLALYRSVLDAHRLVLAPFVTESDAKTGAVAGVFRARYDQLYREADQEGLIRGAGFADIPDGYSMADMAARVEEYPERLKQLYAGESYGSVGSWSKRQEGLGNQLFFAEAQRKTGERLRQEMLKLKAEWREARAEYFKRMAADPFKSAFAELENRAGLMTGTLRKEYESNRQALMVEAESGDYVHCLGEIVASQSYQVISESGLGSLVSYRAGDPGTVEALPGMGFRMAAPSAFAKIEVSEKSVPEEFPLDLPLKYDPQIYIKTEIERLQIQAKAERDAVIAMGTYLTGLEGTAGRLVGETFNVFHGLCEGFGSVGNILIGVSTAPFHPIDTYNKLNAVKDGMVHLWSSSDAKRELIDKGLVTIADFFRGIGSGVELMATDAPPEGVYDKAALAQWKKHAENTRLARETLTSVEKLAGNVLADLATGVILSKGSQAAKLAAEAADTAADLSKAAAQAKKIEEATARLGKVADDVPDSKAVQKLGEQLRRYEDELKKFADEASAPKLRDIPFDQQKLPSPREVLVKASESTSQGGMNSYVKLNDDLGLKVSKEPLIKGDSVDAVASRRARDLDDAGRTYVEDVTKDSTLGRLPQVKDRYYVVADGAGGVKSVRNLDEIPSGARYKTVDVVENIPPSTHASTLAEQGKLTADHVRAYEAFMRDMNAKGYVWMDNKLSNFAFEAVDEAKGIYRVVPLDTGGFYKVGDLPPGFNMSKADFAKKVQKAYDTGVEADVEGSISKMAASANELQKQGIPGEVAEKMDEILGVQKINPTAEQMVNTWEGGLRISSPGKAYSSAYAQTAGKSDDVLARELSNATEASLAANADYMQARASLDAQKALLAGYNAKLEQAAAKIDQAASASPASVTAAVGDMSTAGTAIAPLSAGATQQAFVEVQAAQAKAQCLAVKEKLLAGLKADWLAEAWAQCQKLGFTFEGAR
jgi:hypothetical protein